MLDGRFFHFGQVAHQATLAACGIILVYDAFFRCLIQGADGLQGCLAGVLRGTLVHDGARMLDIGAGATGEQAVAQASLVVLFDTFDCRLRISQLDPPIFPFNKGTLFYLTGANLSSLCALHLPSFLR